ncbi:hypothetical protein EK904_005804, partial [Melospiza melodia maxima]
KQLNSLLTTKHKGSTELVRLWSRSILEYCPAEFSTVNPILKRDGLAGSKASVWISLWLAGGREVLGHPPRER